MSGAPPMRRVRRGSGWSYFIDGEPVTSVTTQSVGGIA
jgi:hypothetical protein